MTPPVCGFAGLDGQAAPKVFIGNRFNNYGGRVTLLAEQEGSPLPHAAVPDSGTPQLRVRRQPTSKAVLLVAAFGAFLAFLDSTIVNVAFPNIQHSFPKASFSNLSWVLNAYNIVLAGFLVAAGRFADLMGRRRMFVLGVAIFTVASGLCAIAGSVNTLIAFRVLQGIGAALLIPASLALVVEGFEPARRAHGVGLWGAAAAIASGLGPPIGGALVALSSWRLAFLVNLPLGILAIALTRRHLVESRAPGVKRLPDLRGALLLAASLGLVTLAVIEGPDWSWTGVRIIAIFVGSAAALFGFVMSSRKARSPLIDPTLLRIRSFAVGNAVTVVAGTGFYAYLLTHIFYLNEVWGYSLVKAGCAVAPAAFVAAIVASRLGKVADRHGHRLIIVPGALVWAASLLWYIDRVGPTPHFLTEWLPGQLLQGVGVGATLPVLGSAALARLPKGSPYATASAVVTSARQLGAVLGISLLVVLIGHPGPLEVRNALHHGWEFAAICFLVVAVGAAFLGRTTKDEGATIDADEQPKLLAIDVELPDRPMGEPIPPDSLADLPMFKALSPRGLAALEQAAEDVELDAGSYLFHQGDPSDSLYVVRSGRLQVMQGDIVLTELSRGAVLGELGLLTDDVRSASVRAVRDTRLVRLTKEQFDAIANVKMMTALAKGLALRIQEIAPPTSSASTTKDVVIAVVALERGAPAKECAAALVRQMKPYVRVVDPGRVDREGLERAERDADKVVLSATTSTKAWRDYCLRVADRIVLVTNDPQLPASLPERAAGCDLVLTGVPASREQRAEWEVALRPKSVHVVDTGDMTSGCRALAMRLAGRSLGVVFGGGGARGFGHLGVLAELEAAGVIVDRYAGTSMGAIVAAWAASGLDAAAADAEAYEGFVRTNPIGDYTLPSKSLIRGRRTDNLLVRSIGGVLIEELPKEFRCVSVDLLNRERVVHRSGPLADAMACSLRLPGIFPPYLHNNALHVDGGVLDNLPVSTLSRAEGPIIAVAIGFGAPGSRGNDERPPGPPRMPSLGDTLVRTMTLASGNAAVEAMAMADLVLRPDATGVGLTEWHQIDRMRESGRATTRAALPQISELLSRCGSLSAG
jgi:EmrB/QacA subfamily drug resistance transporter